jgi:hypothetical protein
MLITGPRRAWRWPAPCIGPTPGVSDPGALVERYANLLIGPAPRHAGLWFNFAHGHQGFTLGPASARLLADPIDDAVPFLDSRPFMPARFA